MNDLLDPPIIHAIAVEVGDEVVIRSRRCAHAAEAVEMLDDRLNDSGADLHLADAGLGLRVGDPEACPIGVVQADVADLDVAQLADPRSAVAENLDHHTPAYVAAADLQTELGEVVADRRLDESQLLRDLLGSSALGVQVRDLSSCQPEVDRSDWCGQGDVLLGSGVDQRGELVAL